MDAKTKFDNLLDFFHDIIMETNSSQSHAFLKEHYEKKLTKNIRPTDILQIYLYNAF